MKGMAALAFGLVAVSCNKSDIFNPSAQQEENEKKSEAAFAENVMDGQAIDANQTWSTASPATVNVSVNLDYDETYTVYITPSGTINNVAYLGVAKIKSGNKADITIAKPNDVVYLQAICYDKDNHATVYPFYMEGSKASISFGESAKRNQVARRAASTGYRWSVEVKDMPDLSAYTTGTLYEMEEAFNTNGNTVVNQADGSEKHLKITGNYSGSIARIQSYANQSVYVTGTWTVPADQRCTGNSVIVVGKGGKIVVPSGHLLSTNANNNEGTTGMIYVMPGGVIEGDGQLQFSNGTQTYSYNGGNITVKNININGGTLYNAGTIGDVNGTKPAIEGPSTGSRFINYGKAILSSMTGAGIAVENACNLTVTGKMEINNPSMMDNGSYTECGELHGGNGASQPLYMGENAYLKVTSKIGYLNNFSIWGPTTNNNTWAFVDVPNAAVSTNCINWTDNDPKTCALDHVYVIVPQDYETVDINGNWKYNPRGDARTALLYAWLNGAKYLGSGYESRQNCSWGYSAPYTVTKDETDNCGISFKKKEDPDPTPNYIYYAFEDLGTTNDFDFNDVVIRVSTPDAQGKSTVELMCAGGTMSTVVTYGTGDNPRTIGSEVHEALGASSYKVMVNTGSGETKPFPVTLGTIEGLTTQTDMTNLPFGIKCEGNNGQVIKVVRSVANNGKAPLVIVVSGDENGKWYWPTEFTNISIAYPGFGAWGADVDSNKDWYKNAAGSVYAW